MSHEQVFATNSFFLLSSSASLEFYSFIPLGNYISFFQCLEHIINVSNKLDIVRSCDFELWEQS